MVETGDPIAKLKAAVKAAGWGVTIDETLAFEHAQLKALLDIWRNKAASRGGLPERGDLDMRLLKPYLRHVSIVDRQSDDDGRPHFRYRLQGTLLAQQFGDQTGKLLENAIPPGLVEGWNLGYNAILEAARPVRVLSFYGQENASYLTGESFVVPLGNGADPLISVFSATYFTPRHMLQQAG